MNTKTTIVAKITSIFFFFFLISTLSFSQEKTSELKKVTLQLKWKHQFQFAGYYAAIEKGFYKEAGIEVQLLEAIEGIEPANAVFDGTADLGVGTSDIVLLRANNKKAVILASIFQHSAQILVASHEAGINHIHDLNGKRIDMEPHAADLITFMNDEGLTLEDCIISDHAFNVNRLLSGEVDAMSAYLTDEPFILRENGFEYTIISPSMGGIDFYGDLLFTSEDMIINNKELVKAFKRASIKGWNYAMNNTNELIDIIYNKYSKRHSKEHLKFEAQKMQRLILPNVIEIGYSNKGRWKQIIETYHNTNMINEPIKLEGLFFEDYLPKEKQIAWESLLIFLSIIFVIIAIATFYFYTTQKLKSEINKREEIQQTLTTSENKYRSLFETMHDAIFVADPYSGNIIDVNIKAIELTGYNKDEIIGKHQSFLHPKEKIELYKENFKKATSNKGSIYSEVELLKKNGEIIIVEVSSGGITKTKFGEIHIGIFRDITQRKKSEKELERYKNNLEELIKERTAELENKNIELERFNKLFVGREFRINELKEKINFLEKNINKK